VLKIGADMFPKLRILATGSSTLAASKKFRDTLAGRKRQVHLVPVLWSELAAFGATPSRRLYLGGLPQALLAPAKAPSLYREWIDSFFARDIQRLFAFRNVDRFNALLEYVLRQSGGQLEQARASTALGISRPTVESHLRALEITQVITLVRPFHGGGQRELVKMPKVYGFDTGFVSFVRGWDPLRPEDHGILWEHVVLEHLQAQHPGRPIRYWRTKQGHEVDFALEGSRGRVDVVECKWSAADFDPASLEVFRSHYPAGRNYLVVPHDGPTYARRFGEIEVTVCGPEGIGAARRADPPREIS
jgi:predicted AAA+ superfamily ATPase